MIQRGGGYDLHSVREYTRGDSLRRVHGRRLRAAETDGQGTRGPAARRCRCHPRRQRGVRQGGGARLLLRGRRIGCRVAHATAGHRRAARFSHPSGARVERIKTLGEADWHAALDALATVSADGRRPVASLLGDAGAGIDAVRLFVRHARISRRTSPTASQECSSAAASSSSSSTRRRSPGATPRPPARGPLPRSPRFVARECRSSGSRAATTSAPCCAAKHP